MRMILVAVVATSLTTPLLAQSLESHLREHAMPPAEYLLAKTDQHRIVIAGESHWQRADAELIRDLVPELRKRNVALAMEVLDAATQADIDALLAAPAWDAALANRIMRAGDWPYVQYRDILHRAWEANRAAGGPWMKIVALGPPDDWREKKIRYDAFMADLVAKHLAEEGARVLVLCGMHHAFTRFLQIDRMRNGRPGEFMERMGNILWRRFGGDVFLVALHKADGCGGWGDPFASLCAPLGGEIDCAAVRSGGRPVAFDVDGSPLAEAKFPRTSFYAIGHPYLRLIDWTDGYVWHESVDAIRLVDLIPLEEYAPDEAADPEKRAAWEKRARDLANPAARASWKNLGAWRGFCPATK